MKRTIEIDDTLQERIDSAIEDTKQTLLQYLEENPDTDKTPCLSNDLDYSGAIHEIVDGAVPIYTAEINDIFYLHGSDVEQAFDDAGIGDKKDEGWPNGWRAAAIYCYIEQRVNEWYRANADNFFNKWHLSKYNNPPIGCYVDESAGSADTLNKRTIEFAEGYGFESDNPSGCFYGLQGLELSMTPDDADSGSHQGGCDDDVSELIKLPYIAEQLDKFTPDQIREGVKETGAWDSTELADDYNNRKRVTWLAACDIRENKSEWLSEVADSAVDWLNEQETRPFLVWEFEDNSLFLAPNVEGAKADCAFVSSKSQEYPPDNYRGGWLHVNERGNCTLYVREEIADADGNCKANDREIWGFV